MKNIIVIGSGISGLGAAYILQKQGFKVNVLEERNEVGGRIRSINWQGAWIDLGAEYLSSKESDLFKLIAELGLSSRVIDYPTIGQITFETWRYNRGNHVSITKPLSLLTGSAMSLFGKLRLLGLLPLFIKHSNRLKSQPSNAYEARAFSSDNDESLETWLSRINPQFLEYIMEPMNEFMYSYQPAETSKNWMVHQFAVHQAPAVHSLDEGLGLIPRTLATKLDVITNARVTKVVTGKTPVAVEWEQDGQHHRSEADGVIVAVPGTKVAHMVQELDAERIRFLEGVQYSPQEIPFFKLSREIPELPMMRMYSRKEDPVLNSITYTSFEPDGIKLFRAKLKVEYIRRYLHQKDSERLDAIQKEAARYFPEAVDAIENRILHRWPEAIPVFYPGYGNLLERFLALPPIPGIAFAGDYLTTANSGAAHRSGQRAAEDLIKRLA